MHLYITILDGLINDNNAFLLKLTLWARWNDVWRLKVAGNKNTIFSSFLKIFALKIISFFTPFAIQTFSINTQQHHKQATRNPSPCNNLYFVKIFQESSKIVFLFPATFSHPKSFHRVQRVSLSKNALLSLIKPSRIVIYRCIHIQFFLNFAFY